MLGLVIEALEFSRTSRHESNRSAKPRLSQLGEHDVQASVVAYNAAISACERLRLTKNASFDEFGMVAGLRSFWAGGW